MTLRVYVTGQKAFGAAVLDAVADAGYEVVGACSPAFAGSKTTTDGTPLSDRLRVAAELRGIPWTESSALRADVIPDGTDVIVAAHSHAFVGRLTRAKARIASIGYHPSALPLHRGRDAIRWTLRDGDKITGGTVYHLTDAVDGGPIAAQEFVLVPPGSTPTSLWRDVLFPLGVDLILRTLRDMADRRVVAVPQDEAYATWEPSWERAPLFRPELIQLPDASSDITYTANPAALRRRE